MRRTRLLLLLMLGWLAPATGESAASAGSSRPIVTDVTDLRSLYEANRWFELSERASSGSVPLFYRAAVAAAFHDVKPAEDLLREVIREAPLSEASFEAHAMLANLYLRLGRARAALDQLDAMITLRPEAQDARATRPLVEAIARAPDLSVARWRATTIRYALRAGNLAVPLTVNGRTASYILDTGANFSLLSESEAGRIGITVREARGTLTDSTGQGSAFKVGVADRVAIGGVVLRHVAFLVVRDDQQPFAELGEGERGVIGLPVLMALQAIRWDREGSLQVLAGAEAPVGRPRNLCFHGLTPVTRASVDETNITLVLDTGATHTRLWPRFAREFASLLAADGQETSTRVTGVGNSVVVESVSLPEVPLRIGGFDAALKPAQVLLQETTSESAQVHGRLGMDVLGQANRVTLDFRTMRLDLE